MGTAFTVAKEKMHSQTILTVLFASVALLGAMKIAGIYTFTITYVIPDDGGISTSIITANQDAKTVAFKIYGERGHAMAEVLEDYNTGFSATLMDDRTSCMISKNQFSFDDTLSFLKAHDGKTVNIESRVNADAIPRSSTVEHAVNIGQKLEDFCQNSEVYFVDVDNAEEMEDEEMEERQISVRFGRCYFGCRGRRCIYTTITVPTGVTLIFPFFLLG